MALVVETGEGVRGADTYAPRATVLAYWANRPHDARSATVAAANVSSLDGAAREASAFIDAIWGQSFRGARRSALQGLAWPRTNAFDDDGFPLPDLPAELLAATAELAARAVSAPLAADIDTAKVVRRVKAGSVEVEFAPSAASAPRKNYGAVEDILAPLLNGTHGGQATWAWR